MRLCCHDEGAVLEWIKIGFILTGRTVFAENRTVERTCRGLVVVRQALSRLVRAYEAFGAAAVSPYSDMDLGCGMVNAVREN